MGNGYAITSVVGRREVMEYAQDTFISSTFWTERIGPTAAIKSLEIMRKIKSLDIVTSIGQNVQNGWKKLQTIFKFLLTVLQYLLFQVLRLIVKMLSIIKHILLKRCLKKEY